MKLALCLDAAIGIYDPVIDDSMAHLCGSLAQQFRGAPRRPVACPIENAGWDTSVCRQGLHCLRLRTEFM